MIAAVAVAGGLGAGVRWVLDQAFRSRTGFPWAILFVNVTGCFAMALLLGAFPGAHPLAVTLGMGFLGGYTTFSTVNVDVVELWRAGRRGAAAGNGLGTLILCTAVSAGGFWLGRAIAAL